MTPEPRVVGYTALGALGLIVGLAASEPAAVAFRGGVSSPDRLRARCTAAAAPAVAHRALARATLEGDAAELRLEFAADAAIDWLELEFHVPARARVLEGHERLVLRPQGG